MKAIATTATMVTAKAYLVRFLNKDRGNYGGAYVGDYNSEDYGRYIERGIAKSYQNVPVCERKCARAEILDTDQGFIGDG